jgi:predicted nucleic acid-binding protein
MIVVDTNVTAYLLIDGRHSELARSVHQLDSEWWVPAVWQHEFVNMMTNYGKFGGFSVDECIATWSDALNVLKCRIEEPDWSGVLQTAVKHGITAYDAQFIWLADAKVTVCVTEDKELVKKFPKTAISMENFLNS